jgi:hypothetical protein
MKKCNDEINIETFQQREKPVPIWMPLTLLMK